jgi:hypothetical protein
MLFVYFMEVLGCREDDRKSNPAYSVFSQKLSKYDAIPQVRDRCTIARHEILANGFGYSCLKIFASFDPLDYFK